MILSGVVGCGGDDDEGTPDAGSMAGSGGDAGGTGGTGGTAGTGTGGTAGTGTGGTAGTGTGGTAGTGTGGTGGNPDDDGGVEPDSSTPDPVLPDDGELLSVCAEDAECSGDDLLCAQFGNFRGYCAEDCAEDTDCNAIGGIEGSCDTDSDTCVIDCSAEGSDGDCPENMECAEITTSPISDPIFRCQYPHPKNLDIYEVCNPELESADCAGDLTCQSFPGLTDLREPFCAAGCMEAADCDDLGSDATPVCDPAPFSPLDGICSLECEEDDQCPEGLTCVFVDALSMRCGKEIE